MKKYVVGIILLLCLGGCKGNEGAPKQETLKRVSTVFTAKDYNRDEESVSKTEHGYYYYSYSHGGFRYKDRATGKEMYLCNKPECKHDGNLFCVATNDKYIVLGECLYDGRIIVKAVEETDTQYLYKLIEIAPDGSMANELVTYYTLEKAGTPNVVQHGAGGIYIHRNKVMLPMYVAGVGGLEDTEYHGCAIVDLNTKEVDYLDEEPLGKDNIAVTDINAYGEYFFYCRKEGKKVILHRYHIKDKTDESHKLLVGFRGTYCVPDDGHVVYLKSAGHDLCVHSYETGENEEKRKLTGIKKFNMPDGTEFESEEAYTAVGLQTDGEYYYVAEESYTIRKKDPVTGENSKEEKYMRVYVYNRAFELVTVVNLADFLAELKPEGEEQIWGSNKNLNYLGDTIYWSLSNGMNTQYMFSCKRSDFLAGVPKFEMEYVISQ